MARHPQISNEGKQNRHIDRGDVAARYLVYNLFVGVSRTPEMSQLLRDIDEKVETLARAVERGWVECSNGDDDPARWCGLLRLLTKDDG